VSTEQDPLVSVIIPNYNHARFLGDAIRSVLDQGYKNVEIIVVDDGSTDNSREIAGQFDDQIHYIYQTNAGLSAARNTGIQASMGSLIGVLDADDMYEPSYISTLVAELQSNSDADGIYCDYQFVDEENKLLPQIEARPVASELLYKALLDGNFFVPESIFLHRYVYDEVGFFDEALRACEDWDVWLRVVKQFKIIHSAEILTRHRILAGSMSTDPLRMLTARLTVLSKHVGKEPTESGSSITHRAYGRAYLGSCVEYIQYGGSDRAYECFQKLAKIYPTLLTEVDTFYQLGCGAQPKGSMGDLSSLNVKESSLPLLAMMKKLFADAEVHEVKSMEAPVYSKMYFSLGLLAYGARDFTDARRNFMYAVLKNFGLLFDRQLISLWIKSLLGSKVMDGLKSIRQRTVSG